MACLLFSWRPWNGAENGRGRVRRRAGVERSQDRKALKRIKRLSYLYAFSMLNQHPSGSYLWAFYAFVDSLYIFFMSTEFVYCLFLLPPAKPTHMMCVL